VSKAIRGQYGSAFPVTRRPRHGGTTGSAYCGVSAGKLVRRGQEAGASLNVVDPPLLVAHVAGELGAQHRGVGVSRPQPQCAVGAGGDDGSVGLYATLDPSSMWPVNGSPTRYVPRTDACRAGDRTTAFGPPASSIGCRFSSWWSGVIGLITDSVPDMVGYVLIGAGHRGLRA
jgi:hypothetical protein